MQLFNTLSAEERASLIDLAGKKRLTLSFYSYAKIENPQQFRDELFLAWSALDALGRIYVAHEGINAQMSVPAELFESFRDSLEIYDFMKGIRLNVAIEQDDMSFLKLTIKVRNKILADGLNDDTFDVTNIGVHLNAKNFNEMLDDSNTVVIDMRNHYESEIGHFEGAITPDVDTFRESLPIIENQIKDYKEDKNILMYCTGGIRCEKASAFFKHKGFKKVYQLEGGIIEYTRQIKEEGIKSKFIGKNFVFDNRLGERITDDIISNCHQCGKPCDTHTNCANQACHLLFIQCEECAEKMHNCCSDNCVNVIKLPQEEQKKLRKEVYKGDRIFKKGRSEALTFKSERNVFDEVLPTKIPTATRLRKKRINRKIPVGRVGHYYDKAQVGQLLIENNELNVGDKLLIVGTTTGEEIIKIEKMMVNRLNVESAKPGEIVTIPLVFRVRKSDKLFKIIES